MIRRSGLLAASVTVLALCALLTACDPSTTAAPSASGSSRAPEASSSPPAAPTATATAAPTVGPIALPTDCRGILSDAVLAQLEGVPLNDPAFGDGVGPQKDGSLVCVWRDPAADTTGLATTIKNVAYAKAQKDLLALAADGYTCGAPQGGTRCEKTWDDDTYPVKDGRTVFWRDGIWIDTYWSNLAPSGYTASIVDSLWP